MSPAQGERVVLRHVGGHRAELVLRGPRFTPELCAAGQPIAESLAASDGVRAVTLRVENSEGGIAPWVLPPERPDLETLRAIRSWVEAIAALPMPTLAVLQGAISGEGLELALACDLRLASRDSTFAMPHLGEGRLPCCGGTVRLPRLVGLSASYELFLGECWSADRALAMGLVNAVAGPDRISSEAEGWAERLAARAPIAARFLKEVVRRGMDVPLDEGLLIEEDAYLLLQTTKDRKEGIRAFLEKRPPRFRGR